MNAETLTVGYEPDFAPLTFRTDGSAGGSAGGMIVDIVAGVAERAGISTAFVAVDLPDQDSAIETRAVDALVFKAIIPDRADKYVFSEPLTSSGAAWFAPATVGFPDAARPPKGERVATPVRGPLSARLRREFPDLVLVDVDTYAAALTAVAEGSAGRAALNFHVGCYLANRDFPGLFALPTAPFQRMPLGFCVANGMSPGVLAAFNAALTEMQRDGEVDAIEARWLSGT